MISDMKTSHIIRYPYQFVVDVLHYIKGCLATFFRLIETKLLGHGIKNDASYKAANCCATKAHNPVIHITSGIELPGIRNKSQSLQWRHLMSGTGNNAH